MLTHLRTFVEPQQGTSYDALLAHAQRAEALGFGAWFTSDHLLSMGAVDPRPGPTDAWTTLAGLARDTTSIRLGTLVSPMTFRWPGHFAVQVAQVDAMSGGRVEVGLGTGWYGSEHRAMGIPFPEDLGERFDRFEDWAAIVVGLLRHEGDEPFNHDGATISVVDNPALPRPAQAGGPPVIIGGKGPTRTPRLAAQHATEWNVPFEGPERWAELSANVRAACEAAGRPADDLVHSVAQVVCVGRDEDELRRRAAAIGREPDELRANGVCGLPDEARARVAAFRDAGCERVYLQTLDVDDLDHLDLLAEVLADT